MLSCADYSDSVKTGCYKPFTTKPRFGSVLCLAVMRRPTDMSALTNLRTTTTGGSPQGGEGHVESDAMDSSDPPR